MLLQMTDINADGSINPQPIEQAPTNVLGRILNVLGCIRPRLRASRIVVDEKTLIDMQIETLDEEINNLKHMNDDDNAKIRELLDRLDKLKTDKKKTTFITQLEFENALDKSRKEAYHGEGSYNVGKLNATYF